MTWLTARSDRDRRRSDLRRQPLYLWLSDLFQKQGVRECFARTRSVSDFQVKEII
jgi:hypothetical protein